MVRIHVEINDLVLHGFDYNDHRRVSNAIKEELSRLIAEQGVSKFYSKGGVLPSVVVRGVDTSLHPKKAGGSIAKLVYSELSKPKNKR